MSILIEIVRRFLKRQSLDRPHIDLECDDYLNWLSGQIQYRERGGSLRTRSHRMV